MIAKNSLTARILSAILITNLLSATVLCGEKTFPERKQERKDETTEKRIEKLLGQMTLDEKISLIAGVGFETVPVARLGIPALKMTDGPAGVREAPATSFPSGAALAATFDPKIVYEVGRAIAEEAKAKGKNVLLAPSINIQRVPHAGRNFEGFGEDPFLAAQMTVAYIKGVQSENVIAAVKHYAANNHERDRMTIDVRADERTLHEIYFPAFRAAVQDADAYSVMASYNKLNGFHATENAYLLKEILKRRWGFQGLAMSDWTAVKSTVPTLQNGLDLEMPTGEFLNPEAVKKALAAKEISEGTIDEMVRRMLRAMILSGILDGKTDQGSIDTPAHRQTALEAARGGIVLLKNEKNALPLAAKKIRSLAVIGPNANVARIGGGGSAQVVPFYSVSPLEGIKKQVPANGRLEFAQGVAALEDTTPVPAESLRTPDGKTNGLLGEFFTNLEMAGEPSVRRVEPQINFRWATGAPLENFQSDRFSTRWTGQLVAPVSGRYSLSLSSNDGGRLYLDDRLIVDVWGDHATLTGAAVVELKAGEPRRVRIEHYENRGNADLSFGWRRLGDEDLRAAVAAASKTDAAIVFVGLSDAVEAETRDRIDLNLPPQQEELIEAVLKANPNTIVVMTSGAPILMEKWIDRVPALVQAFYYGQEGGNALADVLFGKISPSGKLPATFLRRWEDSPAFNRYPGDGKSIAYDEGIFVGYRWFDRQNIEPRFPFGHGLSYAEFKYSGLKLIPGKNADEPVLTVRFDVQNTGVRDAAEVAQVYVRDVEASLPRPPKELKGFQKIFLKAGERRTVSIPLGRDAFAFYEPTKEGWVAERGDFRVLVGSSSRDLRLEEGFNLTQTILSQ